MKNIIVLVTAFFSLCCFSQNDSLVVNSKYLEDQIYLGITYNSFANTPGLLTQNGLSYGFNAGFIRDIPFNKNRNIGIAAGLGYSYDNFNQNLLIFKNQNQVSFELSNSFDRNQYQIQSFQFPIQFRWRTSILEKYKFWRIYGGVNLSYVFDFKSKNSIVGKTEIVNDIPEVKKWQSELALSAGYGTWNFYVTYALKPFFTNAELQSNQENVTMRVVRLGLIFYIL